VIACTPHPGLGTVRLERPAIVRVIDLATCRERTFRRRALKPSPALTSPDGRWRAMVRIAQGTQTLQVVRRGYPPVFLLTLPAWSLGKKNGSPGPIMLEGWTGDSRWVMFAIDPYNSASLVADGIRLEAVALGAGGRVRVATMVGYHDYRAWCGGRLVLVAGYDRIATHNKRLVVTGPPAWRARPLIRAPGRAFGSLACAPDGRSVVVQSQRDSANGSFFATRWQLWRVGLDGRAVRLTKPPSGYADESPRISADGTIYFVRSKVGKGKLFALRNGKLVGPLLSLGYRLGYYGHQDWGYTVTR